MGKHSLVEDEPGHGPGIDSAPAEIVEVSEPTQVGNSWRTTIRTAFQVLVALAALVPVLIPLLGVSATAGWVVIIVGIAGAITRVMADPKVNAFIDRFAPWLRTGG